MSKKQKRYTVAKRPSGELFVPMKGWTFLYWGKEKPFEIVGTFTATSAAAAIKMASQAGS